MARRDREEKTAATGLADALVFLGFVVIGAAYIITAKLTGLPAAAVTMVPVSIMLAYAAAVIFIRSLRLREDQSGDNLYYMGFLFTLTSLAMSLWQFQVAGKPEDIVRNFGVAIGSTIAGIALRIFMNQMRRDPHEVERVSRLELADASRRVRRELDATVVELNQFRRATQQIAEESWADVSARIGEAATALETAAARLSTGSEALSVETAALAEALATLKHSIGEGAAAAETASLAVDVSPLTEALAAHGERLAALTALMEAAERPRTATPAPEVVAIRPTVEVR